MALDPQSEATHTYPLDANILVPFPPSCCVGIPGREQSFLHCGEFIVLRERLAIDAHVDGEPVTVHAKVGRILRITPTGEFRRILLSLLFFASDFPTPMIRDGAVPPDRRRWSVTVLWAAMYLTCLRFHWFSVNRCCFSTSTRSSSESRRRTFKSSQTFCSSHSKGDFAFGFFTGAPGGIEGLLMGSGVSRGVDTRDTVRLFAGRSDDSVEI
jgi:hypothetical protein